VEWSTAAGLGGISALGITLVVAFLILVKRTYELGQDVNAAQANEAAERRAKQEAIAERDDAVAAGAKADGERSLAVRALADERTAHLATIEELRALKEKKIDEAEGQDLVNLGADVLAGRPRGGRLL
jgi:Na+-transporting methylmalonyl-CoA/oxaloacetate decarboxylase gamma subunit